MRIEYKETHQQNENANHNLTWVSKEKEKEWRANDENQFSKLIQYFNTWLCWWLAIKWDKGNTEEARVQTDNGLTRLDLVQHSTNGFHSHSHPKGFILSNNIDFSFLGFFVLLLLFKPFRIVVIAVWITIKIKVSSWYQ